MPQWVRHTALFGLLGCAACDLLRPDPVHVERVRVTEAGPLVRRLEVTLGRPGSVTVTYTTPDGPTLVAGPTHVDVQHEVLLTRLLPEANYTYEVATGDDVWRDSLITGPLEADVAAITIEATPGPADALVLYEVFHPEGFAGALVVDGLGRVVWYHRTSGALTGSTVRADGTFVFVDLGEGLLEVTPAGEVVARLRHAAEWEIHHDVLEAEDGTLLFLTTEAREVEGEIIVGDAVRAWRPGAPPELRWSVFDHLSPDLDWAPRSRTTDWVHANALTRGPRGNVLVSFNFLNQVLSLAPDFTQVEWRLGGVNATIAVEGDAVFSGQHTATELADGRVLMFDNGIERDEPFSRALELQIEGATARVHRDMRPNPDNWSRAISSAYRTPDGLTYVTYGLPAGVAGSTGPVEMYVVGPDGETLWSHRFSGRVRSVYRGNPLTTVGGERAITGGG